MKSLVTPRWNASSQLTLLGLSLAVLLLVGCASTNREPAPGAPAPTATPASKPSPAAAPSPAAVPAPVAPASKLIQIPGGPSYDPALLAKEPGIQILKKYDNSAQPRWTKAVYGGDSFAIPAAGNVSDVARTHDVHRFVTSNVTDLATLFYFDTGLCSMIGREGHFDTCDGQVAHTEEFVLVPGMIERWELNSPLQYTFHVRQGMKWSPIPSMTRQNREITAEDIAWWMNQTKTDGALRGNYSSAKSMVAVDRYTVSISMSEPHADFLRNMLFESPFPRECFEAKDCLGGEKAFSPGPFVLKEYVPRQKSIFERNPEFFLKGLPYLDTISTYAVPDTAAQKALFSTGKAEAFYSTSVLDVEEIVKRVPGSRILGVFLLGGGHSMYINYNNPGPLGDIRVRRAMAMTMDLHKIFTAAFEDFTVFSYLVPHDYYGDPNFYLTPEMAGKWYQFNPEEAKKLVADAGYANGFTLKVDTFTRVSAVETALILQVQWKKYLNIDLKIVTPDALAHDNNYFGGQWDGLWQTNCDNDKCGSSADETFEMFVSTSGTNHSHVKDPKIDELYHQQRGELDPVKRRAILWEYEQYDLDNLFLIRGGLPTSFRTVQPWVMNWGIHQYAWSCPPIVCMTDASQQPRR